jgi:hypothetical protein
MKTFIDTPVRKLKIFIYNFPRGHFKEPEYENKHIRRK